MEAGGVKWTRRSDLEVWVLRLSVGVTRGGQRESPVSCRVSGCSGVTVGGCLVEPDNEHDEDEPAKGAEPTDDGTGDGETLAASLARTGLAEGRDAEDQSEGRQAHQGQDEAGDGETAGGHDPGLLHVVVTQGGLSRSWRFLVDRHDALAG